MRPLLVAKTGSKLPSADARSGDYEDWIAEGMGLPASRVLLARVWEGDSLPGPEGLGGVVVTGSSAMVSAREAWSERAGAWLVQVVDSGCPVLGICYGHQLLAHALGGRVGPNPRGREIGTVRVRLRDGASEDPLFAGLGPELTVQATHVESVLEPPPAARLLASSAGDPTHAFAFGRAAWGVQFHPEFDAQVIRAYLEERRETIRDEGIDVDALLRGTSDSPDGDAVLRRFAELLRD